MRAFELRVTAVHLDETAEQLVREVGPGPLRIVANESDAGDGAEYRDKTAEELAHHHIPDPDRIVFLEVTITDPSEFETELHVAGVYQDGYRVLRVASPAVANAIAALLLRIRDITGTAPHIYFDWTEGTASTNLAATAGDGGSGCGGFYFDRWPAFVRLVPIQSHQTTALSVPLMVEWIWRTVDAATGLHVCCPHARTSASTRQWCTQASPRTTLTAAC